MLMCSAVQCAAQCAAARVALPDKSPQPGVSKNTEYRGRPKTASRLRGRMAVALAMMAPPRRAARSSFCVIASLLAIAVLPPLIGRFTGAVSSLRAVAWTNAPSAGHSVLLPEQRPSLVRRDGCVLARRTSGSNTRIHSGHERRKVVLVATLLGSHESKSDPARLRPALQDDYVDLEHSRTCQILCLLCLSKTRCWLVGLPSRKVILTAIVVDRYACNSSAWAAPLTSATEINIVSG